jgi:hypothetical protein
MTNCSEALLQMSAYFCRVETEPLKLWVAPHSRAARNKHLYDTEFGTFYRIEQLMLSTPEATGGGTQAPILTHDNIELVRLQI